MELSSLKLNELKVFSKFVVFQIFLSIIPIKGKTKVAILAFFLTFDEKKNNLKCFYYLNNQDEIQHRSKEEILILWSLLRRVAGRPKNFVGGGVKMSSNLLLFFLICP